MIKLTDVVLLAYTKLRARKIRTLVTVLLASILFGVLITASLATNGLLRGVDSFRKEGLTSRYIVNVTNAPANSDEFYKTIRNPKLIAEAKKRYEVLVVQKTAEAKRLGLEYSHINDRPPYSQSADGVTQLSINDPNGIARLLLKEKYSATPAFDDTKLSQLAKQYGAIKTFTEESYGIKKDSALVPLTDGKESFYDTSDETEVNANYVNPPVNSSSIAIAPPETTDGIILPSNAGWKPDGSSLPIILPQNVIEQLLKLEKLPANASAEDKFERLKNIRDNIANLSFKMCYRNSVSQSLIQQTLQQKKEIAAGQNSKDYQKPSLLYELPDPTACENVSVSNDKRTTEEKKQAANQELFDAKFGKETTAISKLITFKVVGMSPGSSEVLNPEQEQQHEKARTANDMLAEILRTEGIGQVIPRTLYDQLPNKADYADLLTYDPLYLMGNEDNKRRFVEFANASDAQRFIDEQSCTVQYDNSCKPIDHPYQAGLAFSNSAALDDVQTMLKQWSVYIMVAVMALAALIMWIAIGRTIVDGRHETAVFRAIGFKRIDIMLVYLLYAIIVSVLVAIFAAVVGFTGAYLLDGQLASQLTAQAQYGFGAINSNNKIQLIGVDTRQIVLILSACVLTGLFSVIPPLIRNVRRSPIRDMREA